MKVMRPFLPRRPPPFLLVWAADVGCWLVEEARRKAFFVPRDASIGAILE